jgi:hypothetical protein
MLGLAHHPSDQTVADFMAIEHLGHPLEERSPIMRMQWASCPLDSEQLFVGQANRLHRRAPCCAVTGTARLSRRLKAAGNSGPTTLSSWGFLFVRQPEPAPVTSSPPRARGRFCPGAGVAIATPAGANAEFRPIGSAHVAPARL